VYTWKNGFLELSFNHGVPKKNPIFGYPMELNNHQKSQKIWQVPKNETPFWNARKSHTQKVHKIGHSNKKRNHILDYPKNKKIKKNHKRKQWLQKHGRPSKSPLYFGRQNHECSEFYIYQKKPSFFGNQPFYHFDISTFYLFFINMQDAILG
jgi:hypothetical protein